MGACYSLTCNKCGYTVQTYGPWEFYRDEDGKRQRYGHPVPASLEAARAGIHGLFGELYCADCDRTSEVILVEFKTPTNDFQAVWSGRCELKDEYEKEDAVTCPNCGSPDLILEPPEDRRILCPKCREGAIVGRIEWMS